MLAKKGADVALLDLKIPKELEEELKSYGTMILPIVCDVTKVDQVDLAMAEVARELGPINGARSLFS